MDQILDVFSTPPQGMSRANDFAAWQINSSILRRLRSIKWSRSISEFRIHSISAFHPVYYRSFSRKGSLEEEDFSFSSTFFHEFFVTPFARCISVSNLFLLNLGYSNIWNDLIASLSPPPAKEDELNSEISRSSDCGDCSTYLVGNPYWRPDKLTKPVCFVIDNANWSIRFSLLSTPLVHALCLGSKDLLQAI